MAFSIGHLLTAAGQGATGYLQGKTEADRRREERERQARQEAMQQSMFDYRKQQDEADRTRQATLDERNERNELADEFYRRRADMLARGKERTLAGDKARARPYEEEESAARSANYRASAAAAGREQGLTPNAAFERLHGNAVAHFRQKLQLNANPRPHSIQLWVQEAQQQFPGLNSGDLMTALQAARDTEGEAAPWDAEFGEAPQPTPAPAPQPAQRQDPAVLLRALEGLKQPTPSDYSRR